jgi:hypothetical protein
MNGSPRCRLALSRRDSDAGYFTVSFASGGRTDLRSSSLRSWGSMRAPIASRPVAATWSWSRQLPISSSEEWDGVACGGEAVDLDLVAPDHEVRVDVGAVDAHAP